MNRAYAEKSASKKTFVETIKAETSGWAEKSYVANFLSPGEWHAWRLHCEMAGLGTDEEGLLRSILLPSPMELKQAAAVLKTQYKEDLGARVKSELWGNIRDALTTYVAFVERTVSLPAGWVPGQPTTAAAAGGAVAHRSGETAPSDDRKDKDDKHKDKGKDDKKASSCSCCVGVEKKINTSLFIAGEEGQEGEGLRRRVWRREGTHSCYITLYCACF